MKKCATLLTLFALSMFTIGCNPSETGTTPGSGAAESTEPAAGDGDAATEEPEAEAKPEAEAEAKPEAEGDKKE